MPSHTCQFPAFFSGKNLLCAALALFLSIPSQAQELEGRIRYLVTHDWTKKMAAVDYISKQRRERIAYMWGSRSEWKVFTELYFSPTQTFYQDSEERAEPDDEGYAWRKDAFAVRRDFAGNTEHDILTMMGKTYVVEDSLHCPAWKVLNDLKEVAGHLCMNASWEDTLKHQKIMAWFALDMPLPAGPERLCGLPGIILEADVNDGGMVITADKIELRKLRDELALPKKVKGKKVNEADYRVALKKMLEEKRKAEDPPFWDMRY